MSDKKEKKIIDETNTEVTEESIRAKGFKKITVNDMTQYIEKYAPDKKHWFKEVVESCATEVKDEKTGKTLKVRYNHLATKRVFCQEFMPDLIPVVKVGMTVWDVIDQW